MTRFTAQHTTQQIVPTDADQRDLLEKAQDDFILRSRLTINSDLSVTDGYKFIGELEATSDRVERQATINKWRVYADLVKAMGSETPIGRYHLAMAVEKAQELGWVVEFSKYGTRITRVEWKE